MESRHHKNVEGSNVHRLSQQREAIRAAEAEELLETRAPSYDEDVERRLQLYLNGAWLTPEDKQILFEAHPELADAPDFDGEDY